MQGNIAAVAGEFTQLLIILYVLTQLRLNKMENLLGPLKMCHYDVVSNCYSIVVP